MDHDVCYNTTKAGQEVGAMDVFLNANPWREVAVPHDWCAEQPSSPENHPSNGFKPRGIGWYWNAVTLPAFEADSAVFLDFEGIMGESVVYVNGVLAARNESGYTGFSTDISDYVLPGGENLIVVSVDNTRWEGWWYEGAGIYRPARLRILPPVHLRQGGIFARSAPAGDGWRLRRTAAVDNAAGDPSHVAVCWTLRAPSGDEVGTARAEVDVPAWGTAEAEAAISVKAPALWSPDRPALYRVEAELIAEGAVIQRAGVPHGFRHIEWTDHGMYVNGVLTPVRGICCHQDHAGVGIAVNRSLTRYRVRRLKDMGCNAYRCAHHCPSEYLLRVCDELGMLVMVENRHFRTSDEVLAQLDALVLLSRNHPSVFLDSLFNEEPWQAEPRGRRMAEKLRRRVLLNDDTRPVTAAMNGGVLTRENASDALDVAGMNYFIGDYHAYAARRPGHPVVGTENGPLYATRGIYRSDPKVQVYDSYGLNTAFFGQLLQDTMEAVAAAPHVAGQFIWGGFDYRGEPQPFEWPSVFSHWGLMDNCGFEKDTFHMLKSYYSDPNAPMLHLLPHWNWLEGEAVRVCVMSNCDAARLILNGRLLEEKPIVRNRAEWTVPFEAGTLVAVARKGGIRLQDSVSTAGAPAALEVVDAAPEDDFDCAIVNVRLVDADGRPVPGQEADREIRIDVTQGALAGVGNGDPNGAQPDSAPSIHTFCGRCQVLVRPDPDGAVALTLRCEGLPDARYARRHGPCTDVKG